MKPNRVVHGITFQWNVDSDAYEAQVSPEDIEDVYQDGYGEGYETAGIDFSET